MSIPSRTLRPAGIPGAPHSQPPHSPAAAHGHGHPGSVRRHTPPRTPRSDTEPPGRRSPPPPPPGSRTPGPCAPLPAQSPAKPQPRPQPSCARTHVHIRSHVRIHTCARTYMHTHVPRHTRAPARPRGDAPGPRPSLPAGLRLCGRCSGRGVPVRPCDAFRPRSVRLKVI